MIDHLPECIYAPEEFDPEQNIVWGGKPCICPELRDREQRVLDLNSVALGLLIAQRARERALTAAREAIATADRIRCADDALAAIDAIDAIRGTT